MIDAAQCGLKRCSALFSVFRVARIAREREIWPRSITAHARLYDAGGAGGTAAILYFLEHVDGSASTATVTTAARRPRGRRLFVRRRVRWRTVTPGVVVHRDLKPSNLLVDAAGWFAARSGIAKLLDDGQHDRPELTQQGARVLTPDYASPEQIGASRWHAADAVFTGQSRCSAADRRSATVLKATTGCTRRGDPRRRSAAADDGSIRPCGERGDLDTIVAKGRNRRQRYASVDALPGHRAPPSIARARATRSAWYRGRKFMVRNRPRRHRGALKAGRSADGGAGRPGRRVRWRSASAPRTKNFVARSSGGLASDGRSGSCEPSCSIPG